MTRVYDRDVSAQVKAQYERFPYPAYPLFMRPNEREARTTCSRFQQRLNEHAGLAQSFPQALTKRKQNILVLGCGDTQPWIFHKLEPRIHQLTFLDLSKKNLQRAKHRIGVRSHLYSWVHAPLEDFLAPEGGHPPEFYDHIDAYGVLHHLADPKKAIRLMARALTQTGTGRLMVYNQAARNWIHHIQDIFSICALSPYQANDLKIAKKIIALLQGVPSLKRNFRCMGTVPFKNTSRFVDTFFHAQELRWPIERWDQEFRQGGFIPHGLFDRYAELDDLANPLWQMPQSEQLRERAQDHRLENNFEVFVHRCPKLLMDEHSPSRDPIQAEPKHSIPLIQRLTEWSTKSFLGPRSWFSFDETKSMSLAARMCIATLNSRHLNGDNSASIESSGLQKQSTPCLQRLARIGAILPGMVKNPELFNDLLAPMAESMDPYVYQKNPHGTEAKLYQDLLKTIDLPSKGTASSSKLLKKTLARLCLDVSAKPA